MLAKGELGPSNKPDPTDSYPLPLLMYKPSPPTESFSIQGLKNSPDPAAVNFIPLPFFFAYTTPLPAILSTIAEPAEDPTPANNPVGRPRKYPKNTTTEVSIRDPKYDRLIRIRNNPVSVRLTNVETGEIKIYTSLYKAMNETRHSWRYLKARNGKVDEGFKIEIL